MNCVTCVPLSTKSITFQEKEVSDKKKDENNLYICSSNPIYDALIWGGAGAVGGAGFDLVKQYRMLKNEQKVSNNISKVNEKIEKYKKYNKSTKKLEYELKCLNNRKINPNSIKNWAIGIALITFIPQLILNIILYAGKAGYDKITKR